MTIGYAAGAYDLFHVGHLNILRQAKANCDHLIAGVVHDDVLEQTKGRRPVIPIEERAEIVSHISYVDEVHIETNPDKLHTWSQKPFDVFSKATTGKAPKRHSLRKPLRRSGGARTLLPVHRAHLKHQAS